MNLYVSKKRLVIVGVLAVICLFLLAVRIDLFMEHGQLQESLLSVVMALLVGGCYVQSVRVELPRWLNYIWMIAAILILPYVMVYVIEYLAGQSATSLAPNIFLLNYLWCLGIYLLLFALTNHYAWTVALGSVFCFVVGVVNYFVLLYRSSPLQLTDVLSAGTAANVVSNYVIELNYELLLLGSIVFFAVCLAMVASFHRKRRNLSGVLCSVLLLAILGCAMNQFYSDKLWEKQDLTVNFWNPLQGYQQNGTALSLAMGGKYLRAEKPAHYSVQKTEEILLNAQKEFEEQQSVPALAKAQSNTVKAAPEKPNIIAIMNESYADLSILGEFETSVPYMSFYQSLQKNTIRGNLSVGVLGGGTCNTEFEFLTGLSTAFLPTGVMVYQQYINSDLDSIATILKAQGYQAVAFHPGKPSSWQRDEVYPYLGFDTFLTEIDMENPSYMREAYVTDSSDYKEVIRLFEEKGDDKLFLFNVTIQNHGGYQLNTVDIPKWVSLRGMEKHYPETEQYLSIMHASDEALRELITYFEKVEEPTLIVFFGDHQPSVESAFVEELMGKPLSALSLEEVQQRYKVPFFIWANYDIQEAYYDDISANYLSTLTLKTAGLELPAYHQYLDVLQQKLPMINSLGYINSEGEYHYFADKTAEQELISEYKIVEYNYLFGGHSRLNNFYAIGAPGE